MTRYDLRYSIEKRKLTRDADNAVAGGVCAGLARYLELNPFWLRVAVVLAGLCLPKLVLVSYAIAWVAIDSR